MSKLRWGPIWLDVLRVGMLLRVEGPRWAAPVLRRLVASRELECNSAGCYCIRERLSMNLGALASRRRGLAVNRRDASAPSNTVHGPNAHPILEVGATHELGYRSAEGSSARTSLPRSKFMVRNARIHFVEAFQGLI
jgi:hypothetical protein